MRNFFTLLLLLVASGVQANLCVEVEERSRGRIGCVKDDFGYTLKYHDWLARQLTLASGQYDELVSSLCLDGGGVVRETWQPLFSPTQLRTTSCQEMFE